MTMRPQGTELGFLQNIIENPQDDAVRLIYADWLEENGKDTRANHIREGVLNPARRIEDQVYGHSWVWHRGFICKIRCGIQWWMTNGPMVAHWHPLETVVIRDTDWGVRTENRDEYLWYLESFFFDGMGVRLPDKIVTGFLEWMKNKPVSGIERGSFAIHIASKTNGQFLPRFLIEWARAMPEDQSVKMNLLCNEARYTTSYQQSAFYPESQNV
jgi:uncharacterized protein (TIGR02996 family)